MTAACKTFEGSLSMVDYQAAEQWAGADCDKVRPKFLAMLAKAPHARDRIQIYLTENMIDEAVRAVKKDNGYGGASEHALMEFADAAHTTHSAWVIDFAKAQATPIMNENRASHYDTAAIWLKKAARAYEASGKRNEWAAELEALIEQHKRKYKLRPLLEALRN